MFQSILGNPQFKKLPPNLRFTIAVMLVIIVLLLLPYIPLRLSSPPSLNPSAAPAAHVPVSRAPLSRSSGRLPLLDQQQETDESEHTNEPGPASKHRRETPPQAEYRDHPLDMDHLPSKNAQQEHQHSALDDLQHELGN